VPTHTLLSSRFRVHAFDAKAVIVLVFEGSFIVHRRRNALYIAILLHDIGMDLFFSHAWKKKHC
jgi:hypothetical protein